MNECRLLLGLGVVLLTASLSCTAPQTGEPWIPTEEGGGTPSPPPGDTTRTVEVPAQPETNAAANTTATTNDTEPARPGPSGPRVSASAGHPDGVLLLYPRIIPSAKEGELRTVANGLQSRLAQITKRAMPNRAIERRPEPERICPNIGCHGPSVGVLLLSIKGGCAAVAFANKPGKTPSQLEPWVGDMELKRTTVEFRGKPEEAVTVIDFVPCDEVLANLDENEAKVERLIKAANP